jgi:uroporphyrinogen decarboxylase
MRLCKKITDTTILYLKEKSKQELMQFRFWFWGGMLFQLITKNLLEIHQSDYRSFGRSCSSNCLERMLVCPMKKWAKVVLCVRVDWTCSPRNARYLSGGNITLQVILTHQDCCHLYR